MSEGAASTWREVVEQHHSAMLADLSVCVDADRQSAVAMAVVAERAAAAAQIEQACRETREQTREATRRATAESLNQTLRRLRHLPAQAPVFQLVVDAGPAWARQAVVVTFEQDAAGADCARAVAFRGTDSNAGAPNLVFETAAAAAVLSSIETKDPVVALATGSELSPALADALGGAADERAYLFPISVRQNVTAMLIASGSVIPAPLELLCEAAGMKLETLIPETLPPLKPLAVPDLVQIAVQVAPAVRQPEAAAAPPTERKGWTDLTPDDQRLHLQAQRVARVRVAEMRLYKQEELRRGVFAGEIYRELRESVDSARAEFLQTFLSRSPTMVDYLHLEILRSLANDDDRLLGSEYPGPMV